MSLLGKLDVMTPLEVRQLDGLGAEILGADLASITVGDWNQIEAAFAAFGLLVFRDQLLTEQEHVDFARRWGAIELPRSGRHGVFAEVAVSPEAEANKPAEQGLWHADQSYRASPPLGSVEAVHNLPAGGATTMFASMYSSFDALSSGTQRALEALSAVHTLRLESRDRPSLDDCTWFDSRDPADQAESATHPIVIHHPVSGRKALFVNPTFTTRIEEIDEREGLGLLNQLYEHCQQPEFTTTVEWEPGTVAIWDNRAVWHFNPTAAERPFMHRVTIAGTELKPAISPDKSDPSFAQKAGATLAGGILTAAMTGIAEVIDPERVKQDIEIVSEAPEREDLPDLGFGELPPLD